MQQVLLGFQVLLGVGIIGLVLLQQGRGADAGASFGGGASGSLFGSRGPATFLAKITGALAALFFANSVALAYIAADAARGTGSVVERVAPAPDTDVPGMAADVPTAPDAGSVPAVPEAAGDVPVPPPDAAQGESGGTSQ